MDRAGLQMLAELRIKEARILYQAGAFEGAFYLAGYAVECALKACVAKQTREFDFPERRQVERAYTHNLKQLLEVSGVIEQFREEARTDETLDRSWSVVTNWSESGRYEIGTTEELAETMVVAANGVLAWLKKYW
jgi:HEPN domain-containing protein